MQTIDHNELPKIPKEISICPICGDEIIIEEITAWFEDGTVDGGLNINCVTMPDFDSSEWNEWFRGHWSMPYVDWLPVQQTVERWFNKNYRIKRENQ